MSDIDDIMKKMEEMKDADNMGMFLQKDETELPEDAQVNTYSIFNDKEVIEQDKEFMDGLNPRELELYKLYTAIRNSNDPNKLIQCINMKIIKPTEQDSLGLTPLLFACDCSFDTEVMKMLVKLGCDITQKDKNGDTLLHFARNLEDVEME